MFTQIYHKARLIESLRSGLVFKKGLDFPQASTKKVRKIGSNPIVLRAVNKIHPYLEHVWFLSLVPDTDKAVLCFFDEFPNVEWPLGPAWDRSRWGGVAWEQIHRFCEQENLTDTSRVLEFNKEGIFSHGLTLDETDAVGQGAMD